MGSLEDYVTLHEPSLWPSSTAPDAELCGEDQRLAVLASFAVDALEGDEELARIARFAAKLCDAPTALVSIVDAEVQRFLAGEGIDVSETPRSTSICAHTMVGADLFEVLDASEDERFREFALVTGETHLRYYIGAPLISSEGAPLGALCIIDYEPRSQPLGDIEREGLLVLAQAACRRLQSHRLAQTANAKLRQTAEQLQTMLDNVPDIAWSSESSGQFSHFNARFKEVTGSEPPRVTEDWRKFIHPDDFDATLVKFSHALEHATPFEDEWRLRLKDGSYRWVLSRALPFGDDPADARWFGTLTDIDAAHQIAEERDLLAGELAHRIKNIFSVVGGLVSLHSREQTDVQEYSRALSQSILALSRAQEFALRAEEGVGSDLKQLLVILTEPYGVPGRQAISVTGAEVNFGRKAATPLALVFHELATNSAKYGALSVAEGRIVIETEDLGENVRITWREKSGPRTIEPEQQGFGSRLMSMAIQSQLAGSMAREWRDDGLNVTITLPTERLAQ